MLKIPPTSDASGVGVGPIVGVLTGVGVVSEVDSWGDRWQPVSNKISSEIPIKSGRDVFVAVITQSPSKTINHIDYAPGV